MKLKRKIVTFLLVMATSCSGLIAHSGRTDSSGGHHDYKNKSGLGSYHYHCGGHPAHLHTNGCPYTSTGTTTSTHSTTTKVITPTYTTKIKTFIINGSSHSFDTIEVNGTTLVELRALCDELGIGVSYDSGTKSIKGIKGDVAFTLAIGSKKIWTGTGVTEITTAPIAYNGKTMIPARVVAEAIGKTVTYDNNTGSILIN